MCSLSFELFGSKRCLIFLFSVLFFISFHPVAPPSSALSQLQQHVHRRRRPVPLGHRRVHRIPGQHTQVSQEPQQLPGLHTQVQRSLTAWLLLLRELCVTVGPLHCLYLLLPACRKHTNTTQAPDLIYMKTHIQFADTHTPYFLPYPKLR